MSEILLLFPFPLPAIFLCLTFVPPLLLSLFLTLIFVISTFLHVVAPVVCFDAKINFDDNAEFRQKAVFAMDDMTESDPTEMQAAKWDLKYIGLDGNIACFGTETKPEQNRTGSFLHTETKSYTNKRTPPGVSLKCVSYVM